MERYSMDRMPIKMDIELIEEPVRRDLSGDVDELDIHYEVNGVPLPGATASVGRSAGSYGGSNGENWHTAREIAEENLGMLVNGYTERTDRGYCALHGGRDFLAEKERLDEALKKNPLFQ